MITYSSIPIPYPLVENGELKLEQFSNTDGLTGITNRRGFDTALNYEWMRAKKTGLPLALIMIDVDYFKSYNDRYGYLAGDDCLKQIATAISDAVCHSGDRVARVGGDEFVVLMPATSESEMLGVARRIEKSIAALSIVNSDVPAGAVTLSIGLVSQVPADEQSADSLIAFADAALYRAKAMGRNCIEVAF